KARLVAGTLDNAPSPDGRNPLAKLVGSFKSEQYMVTDAACQKFHALMDAWVDDAPLAAALCVMKNRPPEKKKIFLESMKSICDEAKDDKRCTDRTYRRYNYWLGQILRYTRVAG